MGLWSLFSYIHDKQNLGHFSVWVIESLRRNAEEKNASVLQCPTLFEGQSGLVYMPSDIDMAGRWEKLHLLTQFCSTVWKISMAQVV